MKKGIISAGHPETARAGAIILEAGGNAFDAAIAAFLASFVCEPTYVSAGGGGFMLAHTQTGKTTLFDFFAQTPLYKRPVSELDFKKVTLHFGGNTQDFHVGVAAVATPGNIAGAFHIHRKLGSLPFKVIAEPAIQLAKTGVPITPFQHYTMNLLQPIMTASAQGRAIFTTPANGSLKPAGSTLFIEHLHDALYNLAHEGERLFYEGEIGKQIAADCAARGGYLTLDDLRSYRVIERQPLQTAYRDMALFTNPPPSSGGALIAFALLLMEKFNVAKSFPIGTTDYMRFFADVFHLTNLARKHLFDAHIYEPDVLQNLLSPDALNQYAEPISSRLGNTTHLSVADAKGNTAGLTHSSGAGSDYYVPQTGIMLNNMLGEADLNPHGFHRWHKNRRLSSMMSPTLLLHKQTGSQIMLGSSGSSRIRSALVQVISHLTDRGMPLADAINYPRLHLENTLLNIEHGFNADTAQQLILPKGWQKSVWQQTNMYFGGVNAVSALANTGFAAAADERRSGVVISV